VRLPRLSRAKYVMVARKAILAVFAACFVAGGAQTAHAQRAEKFDISDIWTDTKLYFTAPARWDTQDWLFFGGAVAAVAAAHQYDGQVRRHYVGLHPVLNGKDPHSVRDAAPAAAVTVVTWAFGELTGSQAGRIEAYTMLEAAGFSAITTEGLKYAAGRKRPNESQRVDTWRAGGSSFPSLHSSAAFAIGTVLAESGNDEYRWFRRVLGYGMAVTTSYFRLHDNTHWLSDTVAGAAIGAATARFTLNRRAQRQSDWDVSVMPAQGGGAMVSFNYELR
jgi:membrane-associated phospholipid phosphatase